MEKAVQDFRRLGYEVRVASLGVGPWVLQNRERIYLMALRQLGYDAPAAAMEKAIAKHKLELVRFAFCDQHGVLRGKTLVAFLAMLTAVEYGAQAALMAPTELLAEQHFRSLSAWFQPLGVTVAMLTGSQPARTRVSAQSSPTPSTAPGAGCVK